MIVELNEAPEMLEIAEPVQSKIVELRFFGGLTIDETAHVMQIPPFREICESEPVSPSQIAGRKLDADLENILLFALRKESERR